MITPSYYLNISVQAQIYQIAESNRIKTFLHEVPNWNDLGAAAPGKYPVNTDTDGHRPADA